MIDTLEEVMKREELRKVLFEDQSLSRSRATLFHLIGSLLRTLWVRFEAATAKQAKRCNIAAHRFG